MNTVARHNQRITLDGIRLYGWDTLVPVLRERGYPTDLLVSDVSLGAWRNRHVATELAQQLGLTLPNLPVSTMTNPARSQSVSYGQLVGQGIDAEAEGDRHFIDGIDLVAAFAELLRQTPPQTIAVLIPRKSYQLGRDNIVFIYLLAQWVNQSVHRLLIVNTDNNPVYDTTFRWTINYPTVSDHLGTVLSPTNELAFVPGLLDAQMLQLADDAAWANQHLVPLSRNSFLIRPESRPATSLPATTVSPLLQAIGQRKPHVLAYYQYYGRFTPFLIGYAWQVYLSGNAELGLLLLKRCENSAESIHQKSVFTAQLQGMRIADMRFPEVADEAAPSPLLPAKLRSFLHQTIGWGKAMTGSFSDAELHFDQAASLQEVFTDPLEEAYFNNIRAFAQYRTGNVNQAMRLEKAIEQIHHAQPQEDFRLTYINSINQARLYRSLNDFYNADFYYEKAFATTIGNRSESDLIYTHICRALLNQDQDRNEQSFANWFKAALYWVAASYPEAIGWRTLSGITNRRFGPTDDVIEETSKALLLRLNDLYTRCYGESLVTESAIDAGFALSSRQRATPTSVIGNNLLIVCTSNQLIASAIKSKTYQLLRQFLVAFLVKELGVTPGQAILVNDDGYDTHPSLEELMLIGWQQQVSHFVWKRYSVTATEEVLCQWSSTIRPELSRAVSAVVETDSGGEVQYKRYRPTLILTPKAMHFLRRFRLSPTLDELASEMPSEQLAEVLRLFGRQKIIRLYASELLEEQEPVTSTQSIPTYPPFPYNSYLVN